MVSQRDCPRRVPFSENPLNKFSLVAPLIPFGSLLGRRLLDIDCNAGYDSIHAVVTYGFSTVGMSSRSLRQIARQKFWMLRQVG